MRIDQDVHFTVCNIPVSMRLDTAAPCNLFLLAPVREEDSDGPFEKAVLSKIAPLFGPKEVRVSNDHASIIFDEENDASIAMGIFASLPDWDGESLDGLNGAEAFVDFLQYLHEEAEIQEFRRFDGRIIEFEKFTSFES